MLLNKSTFIVLVVRSDLLVDLVSRNNNLNTNEDQTISQAPLFKDEVSEHKP